MKVLETGRLTLRWLDEGDAAFILRLVNEPSWLLHIGDRGIRTLEAARDYIETGPRAMYRQHGFGLFLVELKEEGGAGTAIGLCGLLRRETLVDVDVGFALLPEFWGQGYAVESVSAVVMWARDTLGLTRLVAVTSPGNVPSGRLLEKLRFSVEELVRLQEGAPEIKRYGRAL